MNLDGVIALLCVAAGFLMIILGFILTWKEARLRASVDTALKEGSDAVKKVSEQTSVPTQAGIGYAAQQQAALTGAAEYVKSLAELAKNLSGLTPAVAAFVIATILFFFAAALAAVDHIVK